MYSGEHAEPQGSGILRTIVGLLVMVALVFGLSWALRTFVFQAYEIPSGSMEEHHHDRRHGVLGEGQLLPARRASPATS